MRGLNYDKMNWQQVFSSNDNITVTLPDGSTFTGPAWLKLVSMLNNGLAKDKNLSDLPDKSAALINLGLGDGKGRLIGLKVITASGIYSPTPGTSFIYAELVGGGGGGGGGALGSGGDINKSGQPGEGGVSYSASSFAGSGGGNAKFPFGGGARRASNNPGIAPTEPGCGGGGGNNNANQTATRTGASGSAGVAIIWEYA